MTPLTPTVMVMNLPGHCSRLLTFQLTPFVFANLKFGECHYMAQGYIYKKCKCVRVCVLRPLLMRVTLSSITLDDLPRTQSKGNLSYHLTMCEFGPLSLSGHYSSVGSSISV